MATQAPYPAVPTSGTAGGILLQKANYRRQESVHPARPINMGSFPLFMPSSFLTSSQNHTKQHKAKT
ncbi:hypothetical protein YE61_002868 [Salmonella enterica subsp. enterica]|nr:hypothetical protein [Salmonella enterica subsp. enterica]